MAELPKKDEKKTPLLNSMFGAMGMQNPMAFIGQFISALTMLLTKGDFSGFTKLFEDDDAPDAAPAAPRRGNTPAPNPVTPAALKPQSTPADPASAARLSMEPASAQDRQTRVLSVLNDAASVAGISTNLMVGVWGKESSFGKNITSPTGSKGDWQFTRISMAETIAQKGDVIAARLRANGLDDDAQRVETMHNQIKSFSPAGIRAYARSSAASTIDAMSYDSEISTYTAAFHLRARANELGLNANKPSDFGMIYAGYNIGAGHAKTILNGGRAQGWEVDANAGVAGGTNQRADYDSAIAKNINSSMGQHFIKQLSTGPVAFTATEKTGKTLDTIAPLKASTAAFAGSPGAVAPVTAVADLGPSPAQKNNALPQLIPSMG